jgi:TPP-dependent pyruvate/acetoin dehydrogenase alpha subunit
LSKQKIADESVLARIEEEVQVEIQSAVQFALGAPYPDPGEVDRDVYA